MHAEQVAPSKPPRLLVVEDEPDIGGLLEYALAKEGFSVHVAKSGQEALDAIDRHSVDLIVLDLMLPDMSGLDVLRRIRKPGPEPKPRVIILSAKKDEEDRIKGFELGADDYMVKPFSPRELVLRIRTTLRREDPAAKPETLLAAGPIQIDLDRHEARVSGQLINLTLTEFRLLADMVRNAGRVRPRETLMSEVWGYDTQAMSRTIDTHVRRLRQKLGTAAPWLDTVRGIGYRIKHPNR